MGSLTEVVASTPTDVLADVALETANADSNWSYDDNGEDEEGNSDSDSDENDDNDGNSNSDEDEKDDNDGNGGSFGGFGGFGRGGFKQRKRSHPRRMHF